MRVQGKEHVPNTYMKLADLSPAIAFKSCCAASAARVGCKHWYDLAQSVGAQLIHSVDSHCTSVSTQQQMQNHSFDQSQADLPHSLRLIDSLELFKSNLKTRLFKAAFVNYV